MITQEVIESIEQSVLCWLATVSSSGEPNVSPKEAFLFQDERIVIAHVASPQSIANIESIPKVCMSFIDVFTQRGFKIRGIAELITPEDTRFEQSAIHLAKMVGDDHEILAVISVEPKDVEPVIAPSYNIHPETTHEDMIRQSLVTYRVSDYQKRSAQDERHDEC